MAVVTLLVAGQHEPFGVLDLVEDVFLLGGAHLGRAGALVARGRCHVADDGHAGALLERQRGSVVLQQHAGMFGDRSGDIVVRFRDVVLEQVVASDADEFGRGGDFGDFGGALVDVRFGQRSRLDRAFQLAHGSEARRRHFQRAAGLDGGDGGVGAAPIGDDHAVEAPFVAQDLLQQMLVFVGVDAVDLVVGGHDGHRMSFAHGDFETGQIQFAHGTFVHHGVAGLAAQLLAVDCEMLRACGDAVALNAANQARCHTSGDNRIFGVVLEVTSAQRVALDVQARAKQHVHVKVVSFLAERFAHLFGERRIPGIGHGAGGREAGGRLGCADAEVVAFAKLPAHAVWTVAHNEAGNVGAIVTARIPFGSAGQHRRLFNDRKIFKFHGFSLALGVAKTRFAEPALSAPPDCAVFLRFPAAVPRCIAPCRTRDFAASLIEPAFAMPSPPYYTTCRFARTIGIWAR